VLRVHITIGAAAIAVEGDVPLPDVLPLIHDWLAALPQIPRIGRAVDRLTHTLTDSTDDLAAAETAAAPPNP
jgi:hypothetical protein